ncbi:MAG TPA: GNAT family N-acetyltransferase [Caulobacteraceae bacterium]|jgi:predicted GNAT family acetyltransferase|nr:GNAT family N-acetyltransferase [Caulobacteraceae bacterium]
MRLNAAAGRLERDEAGQVVFADYRRGEGRLILDHVEAPIALRGSGAAGRLMEEIAAYAREHELLIVPLCGYAAHWLRRKSEHSDLVAP